MTGLIVTKIVKKKIMIEGVFGELEAKKCFQRKSFTKYLTLTLVSMGNRTLREKFNFCFSKAFC